MVHDDCADRCISIHALREEGDGNHRACTGQSRPISIHALREEGDHARYGSRYPGR